MSSAACLYIHAVYTKCSNWNTRIFRPERARVREEYNRLQPCRINLNSSATALYHCNDATPSGNLLDMTYGFNASSTDNGNLASWSAAGDQTFNRSYTYDNLNRLSAMSAPGDQCSSLSWTIDPWGNRTAQNVTGGSCPSPQTSVNSQNQLSGSPYMYDAAGNLTHDGNHAYFYDAENRLVQVDGTLGNCSTATACYIYDAHGNRVEKTTSAGWRDYIFGADGNVVAETTSGGWAVGYLYFAGQRLAEYERGTTYFIASDHLGSSRLMTTMTGSVYDNLDFLPYGEQIAGDTGTTHKFTGKERDSESGNDNFLARYYTSTLGRFMTTDSYADLGNPQSLNLYSDVLNNPTTLVDPNGHWPWPSMGVRAACLDEMGSGVIGITCGAEAANPGNPSNPGSYGGGSTNGGLVSNEEISYLSGVPGYEVRGGELYVRFGFWTPNSEYDANVPGSLLGRKSTVFADAGSAIPDANNGGFWGSLREFARSIPWAGSINIPIPPPVSPVGVSIPIATIPATHTKCIGGGVWLGTPSERVVGGGPLFGTISNSKAVLSGSSWSFNVQITPFLGGQVIWNGSGVLFGPTVALVPGAALSRTVSKCTD